MLVVAGVLDVAWAIGFKYSDHRWHHRAQADVGDLAWWGWHFSLRRGIDLS
jgi:multidrug transporter EmrE-like cation transporter